jgi:PTH2 family peptidyl-tRNA hydrolase
MYKQVIVIRDDLKLSTGKLCSQAAHASISAAIRSKHFKKWEKEGQKKVVLKAASADDLIELHKKCDKLKISHALISDAGRTEISTGTITALGIGPDKEERINKVTGSLPLLK